ncbi:MAG: hypothetical protein ABL929_00310 [Ferruginibacter sp.]|nr:hypothetical protein [Ferruginibacter sp.]
MAINKNHEFEELDGVKCAVVEKNVSAARVAFLQKILEHNKFTVIVVASPPPKAKPATVATTIDDETAAAEPAPELLPTVETFIVGVTDYTFNSTNAIFGRALRTTNGQVVTLAYWNQQEEICNDEVPYFS